MKNYHLFPYFLFLLAFFSCDRPSVSEKEANSVYKSIQRKWQFTTIESTGAIPDSNKVELMSASVDWSRKCTYKDEDGAHNLCAGQGSFNGLEIIGTRK